jgi:hypothetical protein
MPPTDEPASSDPKPAVSETRKGKAAPAEPGPELVSVTLDAATARIVGIERVDSAGARHQVSDAEQAALVSAKASETLERLLERAFEAGIDCALGSDTEDEAEEDELGHALLRSLLAHSAARRLVGPEALGRAVVGALIEGVAAQDHSPAESVVAH